MDGDEKINYWPEKYSEVNVTALFAYDKYRSQLEESLGLKLQFLGAHVKLAKGLEADLLLSNEIDDSLVLVEMQLRDTDYEHLGRMLSYAASSDAKTVVWVASRITKTHQDGLTYLNKLLRDKISFFGIEIEVKDIREHHPRISLTVRVKPEECLEINSTEPDNVFEFKSRVTSNVQLGKLISNARINHASKVVWIAEEFEFNHLNVVMWLISKSPGCFALSKIGDNSELIAMKLVEPKFNHYNENVPKSSLEALHYLFWTNFNNYIYCCPVKQIAVRK